MVDFTPTVEIELSDKMKKMLVLFVDTLAINARVEGMHAANLQCSEQEYSEQAFFELQQQLETISSELKEL